MRLAVSSSSFRRLLAGGRMQLADVPAAAAALGVDAVELSEHFFVAPPPGALARLLRRAAPAPPAAGPVYTPEVLRPLRRAIIRAGVDVVALALDAELAPGDSGQAARAAVGRAVAAARELHAPLLRLGVRLSGRPGDEALAALAGRLQSLVAAARTFKVRLAVEESGPSADPEALVALVERTGKEFVGVCIDLAALSRDAVAAGARRLAPYALHVHARTQAFDERGEDTAVDYPGALAALREAGYVGAISLEYAGEGDVQEGLRKTRELVERHWSGAAAG
jgi:sugar phosphate isomerase/epimerase